MKRVLIFLLFCSSILNAQNMDSVMVSLNQILEKDSSNVEARIQRANLFYENYELEDALKDISVCKKYSNKDPYIYYMSSQIQNDLSVFDSALSDINRAIELEPYPEFFQSRAMIFLSMEEFDLAIKDSYQFKGQADLDMTFYLIQSIANQKMGKLEESIMICKEALEYYPELSEMYHLLAKSYDLKDDDEEAMTAIDQAIRLSPDVEYYYQTKAVFKIKKKINPELTIQKDDEKWFFRDLNLGTYEDLDKMVKKRRKKYYSDKLKDRFINDYESLSLDEYFMLYYGFSSHKRYSPYFSNTNEEIGAIKEFLYQGDYQAVIEKAETILRVDHSQLEVYLMLARAYLYNGNPEKAFENYYKYSAFLESIVATGSGESYESPIIVINISDEYVIMNYLGFPYFEQSLSHHNSHVYDVHKYVKQQKEQEVYFVIDKPFSSLGEIF
ncbi:MAG: DUF4919 domain-containing protein [Bacteroidales bacterium]|nr:DUF4919 domain-containing protein [Bacteroidales bacterium]